MPINMSGLTGGGSPINSIQRGSSFNTTLTIAAVDMDKSVVIVNNAGGGSSSTFCSAYLNSSTQLVITSASGVPTRWQVIEYV